MAPVFWGFRVMFYGALLMFGTVFYATILRFRRKLWTSGRFHKWLVWMAPVGILTILGGWVTAETGRQPWVVYGYLRTSQAVSHLAPAELVFSVAGFGLLYAVMLGAYVGYIVRTMRIGPERDHPGQPRAGVVIPGLARGEVSA